MWAIVVVLLGMLTGPQTFVITETGTFPNQQACQAAIKASVPSKLDAKSKTEFAGGYRQYVCVRVHDAPK
jgi:hypothetical protein